VLVNPLVGRTTVLTRPPRQDRTLTRPARRVHHRMYGGFQESIVARASQPILLNLAGSSAVALLVCVLWRAVVDYLPPYDINLDELVFPTIGAALATLVTAVQRHPCRRLGLVPVGWSLLTLALAVEILRDGGASPPWPVGVLLGAGSFLVAVPLWIEAGRQIRAGGGTPSPARILPATVLASLSAVILVGMVRGEERPWVLLGWSVVGAVLSGLLLLRHVVEAALEVFFWPMYDIRAYGPGVDVLPTSGPLLLVCNHSAYADPFWLGKVVPRFIRPLMLSVFYDLPVVRWLMRYLVRAIRVPITPFRRTAPELDEAVAGLRQGDCIVVFPEGRLRRRPEVVLASFGQGSWRILREVPQTPVVFAWIEGGWGSFSSYAGGKPMQGKRLDRRRKIAIALSLPTVVAPEILADQQATRDELRRSVLSCRRYLGLEAEEPATAQEPTPVLHPSNDAHEINP
jgi:1-acyl-sn-glycerol-3-phosphate acyltransferase